ncbi:hypothetical protein [Aurantimonas sp. 22II-16-19i]|uniref:hypothetical protein n=1 Tax=Aurantimonas sp. 22II-16-19i TaxID=1317114 RepID=UPI0009F7BF5D|nr:hypothetical protein [Aurantimonas sp. 22II-16-19i]ORE87720.1 hypothetical protein ATO4_25238 [Aurantimonas sp. 22II-16-19i]
MAKTKQAARSKRVEDDQPKGGMDGAVLHVRRLHTGTQQVLTHSVRCRPGTFEWRYGREGNEGLYHAGCDFARVWERAGIASAGSSSLVEGGGGNGQWKGLPDGRCVAMDEVREVVREIGKLTAARMVSYCVEGFKTSEIAGRFGISEKEMAAVLHMDLRTLAIHYRYL